MVGVHTPNPPANDEVTVQIRSATPRDAHTSCGTHTKLSPTMSGDGRREARVLNILNVECANR